MQYTVNKQKWSWVVQGILDRARNNPHFVIYFDNGQCELSDVSVVGILCYASECQFMIPPAGWDC